MKSEEVKRQTAKHIAVKNAKSEHLLKKTLDNFKDASWLFEQFNSPQFWNTAKKAMDEFERITAQCNKRKYVREQILIVHIGLGFKEAHHPWSMNGYEYSAIELLEHFVKVCLPLTKKINQLNEAPMEHTRLPQFPTLGTITDDVDAFYTDQAKNDNNLRLKALEEQESKEMMGIWDGAEYMNEVNWPEKKLKKGYKVEICYSYPDEDEENRFMWCCGVVERVKG